MYNTIEQLKDICKEKRIAFKLLSTAIILMVIADDFENNNNKEINEISLKATDLEKQITELREMIEERVINTNA